MKYFAYWMLHTPKVLARASVSRDRDENFSIVNTKQKRKWKRQPRSIPFRFDSMANIPAYTPKHSLQLHIPYIDSACIKQKAILVIYLPIRFDLNWVESSHVWWILYFRFFHFNWIQFNLTRESDSKKKMDRERARRREKRIEDRKYTHKNGEKKDEKQQIVH